METPAIAYLYLYLALSDKDFSQVEAEMILSKLKNNPAYKGMDTSDFISDVYQNLMQLPFDSILIYLENYMSEVQLSDDEKKTIMFDLEEIMEADGIVKKEEIQAFQRIKKYLTIDFTYPFKANA